MRTITTNTDLIARCGLYCGACSRYLTEKCPGCVENAKASWCGVRNCCMENGYANCAMCGLYSTHIECGKLNNFISKVFSLILRSDRNACITYIKEHGGNAYAAKMAESRLHSIKRK